MDNQRLREVLDSPRLPTLPRVAVRILDLVQTPEVSIVALSSAIAADPALAARILKTANSGYYGRVRGVAKLNDAIMVLGLRNVKTLALGFSLVSDVPGADTRHLDYATHWRRSLVAACAAKAVAVRTAPRETEEAFLGGLLHGIGMVAMDRALGERYLQVARLMGEGTQALIAREDELLGLRHTEVGAALAASWNLPPVLTACISHYADPAGSPPELQPLVRCVAIGAECGDLVTEAAPGEALLRYRSAATLWLSSTQAEDVLQEALEGAAALQHAFDGPKARQIVPAEILANAHEALVELSLSYAREADQFEARNQQLLRDAYTDALTGISNRRYLEQFLSEQARQSQRYGSDLSVLLLDVDQFKQVNDRYGHDVGDLVLRHVVAVIRTEIRVADLVGRYGGEEFVVVAPSTGAEGANSLAERIRNAIAATPALVGVGTGVHVTVSVGVASTGTRERIGERELMCEADQALYAAKRMGRNAVGRAA